MPFHRSIRRRRRTHRSQRLFDLQLTSMMDVLVILVVFLLKSYSTTLNSFSAAPGLKLPHSLSNDVPSDSLQITVTPESITFENERVVDFVKSAGQLGSPSEEANYVINPTDLDEQGRRIARLYDALLRARDKAELLRSKSQKRDAQGQPLPFEGVIAIQADQNVNYDVLRKIMYTSATAGYKVFRFLALKKET